MERSEFVNSIADVLTQVTGRDIYGVVNSIKDARFPIYVIHNITLRSVDGEWSHMVERRVHSGNVDRDTAFRGLLTELLSDLFHKAISNTLPIQQEELKV